MRVALQPSYVLHSRPYRDTSALIEIFTAEHGRFTVVAKGVRRRARKGSPSALLQSFSPLLLSFSGHGELKTLTASESAGPALSLRRDRLYSGLYLNELLTRLLPRHDPHPRLFADYSDTLSALASAGSPLAPSLRRFEMTLLYELGYQLSLERDGLHGSPLSPEQHYVFVPDVGLVLSESDRGQRGGAPHQRRYPGADLIRLSRGDYDEQVEKTAKYLLREALAVHLGDKPLQSRALFRASLSVSPAEAGSQAGLGQAKVPT